MLRWLAKWSRSKAGETAPSPRDSTERAAAAPTHEPGAVGRRAIEGDPADAAAPVERASALIRQKRFDEALSLLRDAVPKDAHRPSTVDANLAEAYRELCLALFQSGRVEDAKHVAAAGVAACPESAELHFYAGNLFLHEGNLEAAAASYGNALSLRSAFPEARINLGQLRKRQGRPDEALAEFTAALATHPDSVDAHLAAGDVQQAMGRLAEASSSFRRAIELAPKRAAARTRLGGLLGKQGKPDEALACLAEAHAIDPDDADVLAALGSALESRGRLDEAIRHFRRAAALRPGSVDAHLALGNALLKQGAREEALACYREVVRLQPGHGVAHLVAALSGASTERAPGQYVEKLFDDYAERFDSDLVDRLRYDVPGRLSEAVREVAGPAARDWDVLDLGCGTGLAAVAIAPCARSIVGVDISANMLERAKARNLYRRLERADLLDMVSAEGAASYDLVLAADVLVYWGNFDELASQVRRLLRPGGLFGFSVEALEPASGPASASEEAQGYRLGPSGRYAHSRAYLARLAAENRFDVHRLTPITVRLDEKKPVPGYLALWGAAAGTPGN